MSKENNGHINMIINMSQETENMMTLDIDHTKRIQDDQVKGGKYIENDTQTFIDNQIFRLREVQKLFWKNTEFIHWFYSEFNQLLRKCETKVSNNKNTGEQFQIDGIYMGKFTKGIDKCNGI